MTDNQNQISEKLDKIIKALDHREVIVINVLAEKADKIIQTLTSMSADLQAIRQELEAKAPTKKSPEPPPAPQNQR